MLTEIISCDECGGPCSERWKNREGIVQLPNLGKNLTAVLIAPTKERGKRYSFAHDICESCIKKHFKFIVIIKISLWDLFKWPKWR